MIIFVFIILLIFSIFYLRLFLILSYLFKNLYVDINFNKKYTINHNDLSDFARYFYPFVAIVIEPKKRKSSLITKNEVSKYGTYLRYKRVSKYDNLIDIDNLAYSTLN